MWRQIAIYSAAKVWRQIATYLQHCLTGRQIVIFSATKNKKKRQIAIANSRFHFELFLQMIIIIIYTDRFHPLLGIGLP